MVAVIPGGQLVFSVLAAYAFRAFRSPAGSAFLVYLSTLMVPQVVTLVPLYTLMAQTGLRNTFWAWSCRRLRSPYAIFLLREYFRGTPRRADRRRAA